MTAARKKILIKTANPDIATACRYYILTGALIRSLDFRGLDWFSLAFLELTGTFSIGGHKRRLYGIKHFRP